MEDGRGRSIPLYKEVTLGEGTNLYPFREKRGQTFTPREKVTKEERKAS